MDESELSLITIYSTPEVPDGLLQFLEKVPNQAGFTYLIYIDGDDELACTAFLKINQATSMKVWEAAPGLAIHPNHLYLLPTSSTLTISDGVLVQADSEYSVVDEVSPDPTPNHLLPLMAIVPAAIEKSFSTVLDQVQQAGGQVVLIETEEAFDWAENGRMLCTPDEAASEVLRLSSNTFEEDEISTTGASATQNQEQLFIDKIVNTTPDIIYLLDLTKKSILYVNQRAVDILGQPGVEHIYRLRSKIFKEILHPDDYPRRIEHIAAFANLKRNEIKEIDLRFKVADGSWRWFRVRDRAFLRAEDGTVLQTIGIVQDIHVRKETLDQLREEHLRFRNAESLGNIGSFERILPSPTLICSDEFYRIHGLEPQSLTFDMERLLSFVHPEDQKAMREQVWATHAHGDPLDLYQRIIRLDGSVRYVHRRAEVIKDEHGKPTKVYGTIQDITELKRAQFEALKNKSLMESIFNGSLSEMMVLKAIRNARGEIIDFEYRLLNQVAQTMAGQNLVGKRYLEMNPQDRTSGLFDLYRRVVESGESADLERFYKGNGYHNWFRITAVKLDDGVVLTVEDITSRKQIEDENHQANKLIRDIFEGIQVQISYLKALYDEQGNLEDFLIVLTNEEDPGQQGKKKIQSTHRRFSEVFPCYRQHELWDKMVEVCNNGGSKRFETLYDLDGLELWIDVSIVNHENGLIFSSQIINERKRAEEALNHTLSVFSRAEEVGALGSYEADLTTMTFHFSDNLFRLFGAEPYSFEPTLEYINAQSHPDDVPVVQSILEAAAQNKQPYTYTRRIFLPNGLMRYLHAHGVVVCEKDGRPVKFLGIVQDITERKKAEEEVLLLKDEVARKVTDKYLTLFNSIDEGFYLCEVIFDENQEAVDILYLEENPAAIRIMGRSIVGKTLKEINPNYEEHWYRIWGEVALTGQSNRMEQYSDQDNRWIDFYITRVGDESSKQVVVVFQNITERRNAEIALREREERSRRLVEAYAQAVWEANAMGEIVTDSPSWRASTGQAYEEWAGYGWLDAVHPEDQSLVEQHWKEAVAAIQNVNAEFRIRNISGEYRWTNVRAIPLRNNEGKVIKWVGMNIDIHDQKVAEGALRKNENFLSAIFTGAEVGLSVLSTKGRFLRVNDTLCRLLGRSADELLTLGIADVTHPDDIRPSLEMVMALIEHKKPQSIEKRYLRSDGSVVWAKSSVSLITNSKGEAIQILAVTTDLTERIQAEEALRKSEEQFRLFVMTSNDTLYKMSPDWRQMLQLQGNNFLADTEDPNSFWLEKYVPVDEHTRGLEAIERAIQTKGMFELEHRVIKADGTIGWTYSRAIPLMDEHGDIIEWFGTASDITERKNAEAALRRSEEQFRLYVTASSDLVYKMSPDWSQMYSLHGKDFLADTVNPSANWLQRYVPEEDWPLVVAEIQEATRSKKIFELEHRVIRVDGTVGWLFSRAVPVLDERGDIVEWLGAARDVTVRKTAELQLQAFNALLEQQVAERTSALKQSMGRLEAAINVSPMVLSVLKSIRNEQNEIIDFYVDWVSKSGEIMVGKDVSGGRLLEEFPYLRKYDIVEEFIKTIETGKSTDYEYLYNEGEVSVWVRWKAVKLEDGLFAAVEDITRRKNAELQVEEQEHFIRSITETMPDMISVMEYPSRTLKYINREPYTLQGFDADDMLTMSNEELEQLMHPEDIPATNEYFNTFATLSDDEVASYEYRAKTKSGEWLWFRVRGRVFERDETGLVKTIVNVVQNINEQKKATEEMEKAHEQIRAMFEAIPLHLTYNRAVRDTQGKVIDFTMEIISQANLERSGLTPDAIGKPLTQIRAGIEALPLWESMLRVASTGESVTDETYYNAHGYQGWILANIVPFMDGVLVAALNINDRKRAENDLNKQLAILMQSEEVARMGSWEYDVGTDKMTWSEGMYRLFEIDPRTPVSLDTYNDFALEDDREYIKSIIQKLRMGEAVSDETIRIQVDTSQKYLKLRSNVLTQDNEQVMSILGIDLDVTESVEAEIKLRQLTENLQIVLESSPAYIGYFKPVRDANGQIVDYQLAVCNSRFAGYMQTSVEQLIGTSQRDLDKYLWPARTLDVLREVHTTGNHVYEERHSIRNGEDYWLGISVLKQDDGVVVTGLNVTKIRQAEQQEKHWMQELERSNETMSTLEQMKQYIQMRGEFLRTTSHDLRGSFGVIVGATSLLDMMNTEEERAQTLHMLRRSLKQVNHMMNQLLDFSRLESGQEELHVAPFDAAELLIELSESVMPLAQDKNLWIKAEGPKQLRIEGDNVKLSRIVQNLLLNAIKYTSKGGINISWRLESEESPYWLMTVGDTGPGLSQKQINQLTDTTTTAFPNEEQHTSVEQEDSMATYGSRTSGEGIGLFIVKRLCELMHADLKIESTASVGTVFRIRFPVNYSEHGL